MTGGDQREPLWASSLADQPRREEEPLRVRAPVEPQERPEPPPVTHGRPLIVLGALAAVTMVSLAIALAGDPWMTVEELPSAWGDVPMTCETMRLEQDERALEWFRCFAVGGGALPPGVYRSPVSQWTSDVTRRDAVVNEIEITPDGELTGWAAY
jgi:hypothetical protein